MSLTLKIVVITLIFLGEALSIYAEMLGARTHAYTSQSFTRIFFKLFIIMTFTGALLLAGYMLGFKAFQNIWIVSVISITSILMIEPILAYTFFKQIPTRGAFIGLMLGFPQALVALILSFLTGAIFSIILIIFGKKHFGQTIAFGPFLVLGSIITLFWGSQIIDWYLKMGS